MAFTGTDSCGNSAKNTFVTRFEEHLFAGARDPLAEVVATDGLHPADHADGHSWQTATGRAEVVDALLALSAHVPETGHLEAAITHGKAAAAWGYWQTEADSNDLRHFSHTMWFTTHKAEAFAQNPNLPRPRTHLILQRRSLGHRAISRRCRSRSPSNCLSSVPRVVAVMPVPRPAPAPLIPT